jgi:hypothetical protein
MDALAQEIITLRNSERNRSSNIKNLYQQFADLGYPLENQIMIQQSQGQDNTQLIRDSTAIKALNRGTSGFIGSWIPREKYFFDIRVRNRQVAELPEVKWWVALAVQIAHEEIFDSNFDNELHNNIKSSMGFGTGCLYVEWDYNNRCLNFQDWHVSNFEFMQDASRKANAVILTYKLTARQIADKYKNPGEQVTLAASQVETQNKEFEIIRVIRPRKNRDSSKSDTLNMPFEDITVNAAEQIVMKQSGFPRFPFAVNRWEVGSSEKWGRGCGVQALSEIKDLQQKKKDYTECCQRLLRPPYLTREIEGSVNMFPDGRTEVMNVDDIKALSLSLPGAFPVSKDEIVEQRQVVNEFFYNDVFSMFTSMTGDRRTTLEIQLKYREGLRMLVSPVSRQQVELFNPILSNVINILIEERRIPPAPQALVGMPYSLEYQGELAMAMKEFQARGFERAMALMANAMPTFPDMKYQINLDRTMPDILTTYGMKIEHLNTPEEKTALRAQDAEREQMMAQLAQMQAQSESYKNTQKSPEQGSPAAEMAGI